MVWQRRDDRWLLTKSAESLWTQLGRLLGPRYLGRKLALVCLELEEIGQIRLVLVSTDANQSVEQALRAGYIKVDWGTSFVIAHGRHFPDMAPPVLRVSHGRMALALLLQGQGTAAYIAEPMVQEYIASGGLHRVENAPVLDRAFHAVTPHAIVQRRAMISELINMVKEMTRNQVS